MFMTLSEKDARLVEKIRTMNKSGISERILWGKVFLSLCGICIILLGYTLARKGFSSINIGNKWEMYALVILVTFSMGFGFIRVGRLLRIIKCLANKKKDN